MYGSFIRAVRLSRGMTQRELAEIAGVRQSNVSAIENERRPEIEASQAIQLRAYNMVRKPLFVQHLMFTILGIVMRFKKFSTPALPSVEPRFTRTP